MLRRVVGGSKEGGGGEGREVSHHGQQVVAAHPLGGQRGRQRQGGHALEQHEAVRLLRAKLRGGRECFDAQQDGKEGR
jgi:hypothetical protein